MRRLALTVLLAILAVPSPAAAKEVQSVTVCGVGDCTTSKDADLLSPMIDIGTTTSAPNTPAAFYRVTMTIGDGEQVFERFRSSWVPSAGRLRAEDGNWLTVRPAVRRGLDRLTRGLAALPATQLPGFATADTDVAPPRHAAPVTSDSDLPITPVLAVAVLLTAVGLLARRHVLSSEG